MKIHPSITQERVVKLVQSQMFGLEDPGLCIACGAERGQCEPDAQEYECEECEQNTVYGAQELLFHIAW